MTTIDTLLTLDADDPALRRGIAEMRGYEFKEGRWSDDYWLMWNGKPVCHYKRQLPGAVVEWWNDAPDWTHSVDAALELVPDGWDIAMDRLDGEKTWGVYIADAVEVEDPYYVKGTSEDSNLALAICRAWLASKR